MQHDEPLAPLGVHRATGEVVLAARRRVVLPTDRLRRTLAEEVDGERGVDRYEVALVRDDPRVVHVADGVQLDGGVLVQELVQPRRAERERSDGLGAVQALADAIDHAGLHEVDHTVGEQLGVDAEVLVVGERRHDRVGDRADTGLDGRAVRDPLCDQRSDLAVGVAGGGGRHLDEWSVAPAPADHLRHVDLVAPERAWHGVGDLEEEPATSDEARGVVGRHAEREVAVAIGRRRRGDDQRVVGAHPHQRVHLGEVGGDQPDRAAAEVRARHVGQEVRDVLESGAVRTLEVRAVVEGVHLVHPNLVDPGIASGRRGVDLFHDGGRFAVAERNDDLGAGADVFEDVLGPVRRSGGCRGHGLYGRAGMNVPEPPPSSSAPIDPALVPVKPAATVMLVRDALDGDAGVEVFMLRRTANAVFGAGMFVFPGGRVDGVDGADDIAPFCRGLDDDAASRQLGIDHGGLAYWVAAIRECFEEAGVLLAAPRNGGPLALRNEDRHEIHDSSLSMVELCRRDDLVLDLSTTHYVDHWITPIGEQRRFDTRFFVTELPDDQEPLHDDKETVESSGSAPPKRCACRPQAS